MVTEVFFESNWHAERVAVFADDEIYNLCVPALERYAKKNGKILTEREVLPEDVERFPS